MLCWYVRICPYMSVDVVYSSLPVRSSRIAHTIPPAGAGSSDKVLAQSPQEKSRGEEEWRDRQRQEPQQGSRDSRAERTEGWSVVGDGDPCAARTLSAARRDRRDRRDAG